MSTDQTSLLVGDAAATGDHSPEKAAQPQRTDLDLEYFRRRLMEEKALAEETIRGTKASEEDGTGAQGMERNELADYDEDHPGDTGTETFLREQDMALVKNARDILVRIDRALQKLDEGTYGICDRTHKPIPPERLEAIPYATLTVEAQALQEIL